jgi:CRISPR-associated endonuclease/helicase Cas3
VCTENADLLLYATLGAIARHHAPLAHTYEPVRLQPGAENAAQEALEMARQGLPWSYQLNLLNTSIVEGDDLTPATEGALITVARPGRQNERETWLYFLLVRALRLADQRADRFRETAIS